MKIMRRSLLTIFCVYLFFPIMPLLYGGVINCKITKLNSLPRAQQRLVFIVRQRRKNRNEDPQVKQGVKAVSTGNDGKVQLIVDNNKLYNDTNEIFVDLIDPDNNLEAVTLNVMDGTATHDIKVVMRLTTTHYQSYTVARGAFEGEHGSFHLLGERGTALYTNPRTGNQRLVTLISSGATYSKDDTSWYYREDNGEDSNIWAFEKKPTVIMECRCGVWTRREYYKVWINSPRNPDKLYLFDRAKLILAGRETPVITKKLEILKVID